MLTNSLPANERYGLTSQIQRAVVSIPSNIAEGAGRPTEKELVHFLSFALGSAYELETELLLAGELGYITCLNGDWDFRFYRDPKMLPDTLDTESISFDVIDVPSCWQFRGYMKPFYVNTRYQFPYNPPVIPTDEPVGKVFSWMGAGSRGCRETAVRRDK